MDAKDIFQNGYDKEWWDAFRREEVEIILELTGVQPLVGLSVRMADKFQRLKAFCRDGKLSVNDHGDTARDIFRDLVGYSLIAIGMLERDK